MNRHLIIENNIEPLVQEIIELEGAYADALIDELDLHLLNSIWKRIKELRCEVEKIKKQIPGHHQN